jgi:phosphatidylinositol glycan class S
VVLVLFPQPFFLPVSMLVLLAALREWRRYKQEKAKYLLWKAKEKVAS